MLPLPKSHKVELILPCEWLVNVTTKGEHPFMLLHTKDDTTVAEDVSERTRRVASKKDFMCFFEFLYAHITCTAALFVLYETTLLL